MLNEYIDNWVFEIVKTNGHKEVIYETDNAIYRLDRATYDLAQRHNITYLITGDVEYILFKASIGQLDEDGCADYYGTHPIGLYTINGELIYRNESSDCFKGDTK